MKNIRKLLSIICIIASVIPIYGQKDTITSDGLYLKYNSPLYRAHGDPMKIMEKIQKNEDLPHYIPNDSDMIRGEFNKKIKRIGLTYKALPQYITSEEFILEIPTNPKELFWTVGNLITSQWTHKDGECILFFKFGGGRPNKSYDKLPDNIYYWIKQTLGMGSAFKKPTDEEIQMIKNKITIWTPEKAKKAFNAQHVITYPIKSKESVYMGKYKHKLELIMIKWGQKLTVSFLVTQKGKRNIDKYIKDVEEAFWFED